MNSGNIHTVVKSGELGTFVDYWNHDLLMAMAKLTQAYSNYFEAAMIQEGADWKLLDQRQLEVTEAVKVFDDEVDECLKKRGY